MMNFTTCKNKIIKIFSVIFWICIWQIIYYKTNQEILIVSPFDVFKRLCELIITYEFWITSIYSIIRIILGSLIGIISGILLAILTSKLKIIYYLFYPLINIIKATPVTSFIIITLVWIHSSYIPVFISFLMVLPIIWSNMYQGILKIDKKYIEMANIFNFNFSKKFKYIYIPSILPYLLSSCTASIGLAWKAGIAAEVISTPKISIGSHLYDAKIYMETADLFAWTITIIILSIIFENIVIYILKNKISKKLKIKGIHNEN